MSCLSWLGATNLFESLDSSFGGADSSDYEKFFIAPNATFDEATQQSMILTTNTAPLALGRRACCSKDNLPKKKMTLRRVFSSRFSLTSSLGSSLKDLASFGDFDKDTTRAGKTLNPATAEILTRVSSSQASLSKVTSRNFDLNLALRRTYEPETVEPVPLSAVMRLGKTFAEEISTRNNNNSKKREHNESATRSEDPTTLLSASSKRRKTASAYKSRLHEAIQEGTASADEMIKFIESEPASLTLRDGRQARTPLALLLTAHKLPAKDVARVGSKIVSCSPMTAAICDRRENTPLHLIVAGASRTIGDDDAMVDMAKRLIDLYPRALFHPNFHCKTPLQLCQERMTCCEKMAQLLFQETEARRTNDLR